MFKSSASFLALSVQYRPKFGRRFVHPLYVLFGHFWVMLPNNRPVTKQHLWSGGLKSCAPFRRAPVSCYSSVNPQFMSGHAYIVYVDKWQQLMTYYNSPSSASALLYLLSFNSYTLCIICIFVQLDVMRFRHFWGGASWYACSRRDRIGFVHIFWAKVQYTV